MLIASVPHLHKKWDQIEREVGASDVLEHVLREERTDEPADGNGVALLEQAEIDHFVAL
jgi:hypothetical protein